MRALLLAGALAALSGCVAKPQMYDWGKYDEALYKHYREPQDREAWLTNLKVIIRVAEQQGRKVPPGLYAEYGYALVEEGRYDEGIAYFRKEREKWPESRVFMEKMIQNAERLAGRAPAPGAAGDAKVPAAATGPAGALERKP